TAPGEPPSRPRSTCSPRPSCWRLCSRSARRCCGSTARSASAEWPLRRWPDPLCMTDPIEQACFWLARRAPRGWTELSAAEAVDVGIVGAGLTGLWTALFLKALEPTLAVGVVEQGLAAHGASGRNAGMLSETVDHGHGLAIEHFGEQEARVLARLGEANVAE